MMTVYRLLADVTVLAHLAYASFIGLGLLAILLGIALRWRWIRNFWFRLIHLLMIAGVAAETCLGIPCPLTVWENRLRLAAGEATYPGSFLGTLANRLLFFEAPEWVFSVLYVAGFLVILGTFLAAPPRWPRRRVHDVPDRH